MNLSKIFTDNVRQILFATIPLTYLGILSLDLFIRNNPDGVAKLGAFITIWALINISIGRTRYGAALAAWEQSNLWEHIRYYEERAKVRDESLTLTFDLHAYQIARISDHVKIPHSVFDTDSDYLDEFGKDLDKRMKDDRSFFEAQDKMHKRLTDFKENYKINASKSKSWEGFLYRVEIVMAAWGTLQSSYGADIVKSFHHTA